jgi:hypothetical protein
MTTLKMIIAVVGSLIFLGLFAAGFNTAHHQEMALKSCGSKANVQEVNSVNFSCLAINDIQAIGKG